MHEVTKFLIEELRKAADPKKAKPMQAYMKTTQFFYGVQTPQRRTILKKVVKKYELKSYQEYKQVIEELWQGKSREEMYLSIDVASHYKEFRTDRAMPLYEKMVNTTPNWDTLDGVAAGLVGGLVRKNRNHEKRLKKWLKSKNFWVRRAALLAHLGHKDKTNSVLLAESIEALMHDEEFFIRKAIGWALREYAYTNPKWVRDFVNEHENNLSALSKREALKHIQKLL